MCDFMKDKYMETVQDIYGARLDYPIEHLIEILEELTEIPFDSMKTFKAWLLTPGVMSELYKLYTEIDIYSRPAYSDIIEMKKYINLYTSGMQRILSLLENESPYRIAQYEGILVIENYLENYYHK